MEGWVEVVLAVVAVAVALVAVDRLTAAGVFDRREDRPRERRPGGGGGGALGALLDFYDPSHHHLTEEQQRERSTTVQAPGEAPPLIDLDIGVAVIEPDADRRACGAEARDAEPPADAPGADAPDAEPPADGGPDDRVS